MKFLVPDGLREPRPEKAAAKERDRPKLSRPWLVVNKRAKKNKKGVVYATDGYVAVAAPVVFGPDEQPADDTFDHPMPTKLLQSHLAEEKDGFFVAVNAAYLKRLADALGSEQVLLEFSKSDGHNKPIRVRPLGRYGNVLPTAKAAVGALMPVRVTGR